MKLEHKTERLVSKLCQPVIIKYKDILSLEKIRPAIGSIERSQYVEQRRLADSRCSDYCQGFSGIQIKVYLF